MKLSELNAGCICKIVSIDNGLYGVERFKELGITSGVTVKLVRYAPLGDPSEIGFRGFLLAIRVKDAEKINVVKI